MPKLMKSFFYKWSRVSLCLVALVWMSGSLTVSAQQHPFIEVLTEATPFTLQHSLSKKQGEATTFVESVLAKAGINNTITYTPWRRSYQHALSKPNVLIYPIARTELRENDFIWVGNIIPVNYFLFKLKSRRDIQLNQIDQAKQYSIGVVDHHAHHEYLISKGFSELQVVNSSSQNLNKLLLGRIELFPMSSGGLLPLCQQTKIDCNLIEPVISFEDFSNGLYMAFSKDSDPSMVQKVKDAYSQVRSSPVYGELFSYRISLALKVESSHTQIVTKPNNETNIEEPNN